MLCFSPLSSPRADGRNIRLQSLFLRRVGFWREFDQRVKGHFHPRTLFLGYVHKVCVDAPEDCLMRDDQDVFAALELHDDGLQSDDDVAVRFTAQVAVVVFVFVALCKVFGVLFFDLCIREAVAYARVKFVQGFPFELLKRKEACCLDCTFQRRGPHCEPAAVADRFRDQAWQGMGVGFAALRYICIPANLARKVVLRFAVLQSLIRAYAIQKR